MSSAETNGVGTELVSLDTAFQTKALILTGHENNNYNILTFFENNITMEFHNQLHILEHSPVSPLCFIREFPASVRHASGQETPRLIGCGDADNKRTQCKVDVMGHIYKKQLVFLWYQSSVCCSASLRLFPVTSPSRRSIILSILSTFLYNAVLGLCHSPIHFLLPSSTALFGSIPV